MSDKDDEVDASSCPACGSVAIESRPALVSPWVRVRCSLTQLTSCYIWCPSCHSGAFSVRYTGDQMDLLYSGYRDDAYFELRNNWEPRYTRSMNDAFGASPSVVAARHTMIGTILRDATGLSIDEVSCAFDVGGDRGQFLPGTILDRYVYDPSDRPVESGVQRATSLDQLAHVDAQLVLLTGVLEHVSDPYSMLSDMCHLMDRDAAVLIIAVPAGVPSHQASLRSRIAHALGYAACRWRSAWRTLDRADAVRLGKWRPLSWLVPLRQSEHLTFFTADGFEALCRRAGLDVLHLEEYDVPAQLTQSGRLKFAREIYAVCRVAGRRTY